MRLDYCDLQTTPTRSSGMGEKPWIPRSKMWVQPRPKVTIGIGLICEDCIILASDSQTTRNSVKSIHTQKLEVIDFLDSQVLVAQAGSAELSDKAIRFMREGAKGASIKTPKDVVEAAEFSVRKVFKHYWDLYNLSARPPEEAKQFFWDENYRFSILVAHHHNKIPYLFSVRLDSCSANETKRHYQAIGVGRDIGECLMDEYIPSKLKFEDGYPMLVYVVEKVIDNVAGCGRPTWVGLTVPVDDQIIAMKEKIGRPFFRSEAFLFSREEIDLLLGELQKGQESARETWREHIRAIMKNVTQKRLARIWEEGMELAKKRE